MALAKSLPLSGLQWPDAKSISLGSSRINLGSPKLISKNASSGTQKGYTSTVHQGARVPDDDEHRDWWKSSKCLTHSVPAEDKISVPNSFEKKWKFIVIDHFNVNKETAKLSFKIYSRERNNLEIFVQ